MSPALDELANRLIPHLRLLYDEPQAQWCLRQIIGLVGRFRPLPGGAAGRGWDQRDVVLICYGDQVQQPGVPALQALHQFLNDYSLHGLISTIHLLPFFPYSSDDGFSVIDYRAVNPALGTWSDVVRLAQDYRLMVDLVLNHVSRRSRWFQGYLAGQEPYRDYFIEVSPEADLSGVRRPRATPLLTPVQTAAGQRYLWTTFSPDQIDLNYANPRVLVEMLDVLLFYVSRGARVVRLDAIAYLWKQIGTPCIHLAQTHAVVRLMRLVLDELAPGTLLLTETNVPHEENVSYFGRGDEAHLVYQFSLPPLILDALLAGDATALSRWAAEAGCTPPGTTVLNMTASHDGIGVTPLHSLVPARRLIRLVEATLERGGQVSMRARPDGSREPYELNITWFSALSDPAGTMAPELHLRRFMTSQAIMLATRGIPAVYFLSLLGTPNWAEGAERTGQARSINRRKFDRRELDRLLQAPGSTARAVLQSYKHLLAVRVAQPAFHPETTQRVLELGPAVFAIERICQHSGQLVLSVSNVTANSQHLDLSPYLGKQLLADLLGDRAPVPSDSVELEPYQTVWLTPSIGASG